MASPTSFWEIVAGIRELHPRYRPEAYGFVMAALATTVEALPAARRVDPLRRHLSAQELLSGVAALARREFGRLAPMVFREWGVRASEDVGEIVFQLIGVGQLGARPEDRAEDFSGGIDLQAALASGPELESQPPAGGFSRSTPPGGGA